MTNSFVFKKSLHNKQDEASDPTHLGYSETVASIAALNQLLKQ